MQNLKTGDRVQIIDAPDYEKNKVGKIGVIVMMQNGERFNNNSYYNDDIMVILDDCGISFLKSKQLKHHV